MVDAPEDGTKWSGWQTAGVVIIFVVVMGLLGASVWGRARSVSLAQAVTWRVFALLGVAMLAVVLPRVTTFKFKGYGADLQVGLADARSAAEQAQSAPTAQAGVSASEPTPALATASTDPLSSIELSRRALSGQLNTTSKVVGVAPTGDLAGTALALQQAGHIDPALAGAVEKVAAAIQAGKAVQHPAPELALEVDYATQLITGQLKAVQALAPTDSESGTGTGSMTE